MFMPSFSSQHHNTKSYVQICDVGHQGIPHHKGCELCHNGMYFHTLFQQVNSCIQNKLH